MPRPPRSNKPGDPVASPGGVVKPGEGTSAGPAEVKTRKPAGTSGTRVKAAARPRASAAAGVEKKAAPRARKPKVVAPVQAVSAESGRPVAGAPFLDPVFVPMVESGAARSALPKQLPPTPARPALTEGRHLNAALARVPATTPYEPTLDEIAERAYQIYQRRGGIHGKDMDDWLEAERQLRDEHSATD